MSDLTEAIKGVHGLSKLVNQKLFRNVQFLAKALDGIDSLETAMSQASNRQQTAEASAKTAEEKLSVVQNALTKAEEHVKAVQDKVPGVEQETQKRVDALLKAAQVQVQETHSAASVKLQATKADIQDAEEHLAEINADTDKAASDYDATREKLRLIREEAQKLAKGL